MPYISSTSFPRVSDLRIFESPIWRANVEELYQAFDSVQPVKFECAESNFRPLLEAAKAFFAQPSKQQYVCVRFEPSGAVPTSSLLICVPPLLAGSAALLAHMATGAVTIRRCLTIRLAGAFQRLLQPGGEECSLSTAYALTYGHLEPVAKQGCAHVSDL